MGVGLPPEQRSSEHSPRDGSARGRGSLTRFLWVSVPKLASGVGTVALNLFLIRRLTEENLALFSLCLAGVLLVDSIAGSALDMGTLKLASSINDTDRAASLDIQKHAIYLKVLALGFACLLVGAFGRPFWSGLTHQTAHFNLVYLSLAATGGLLLVRSAQVQMQVDQKFMYYGLLDTLHIVLRFGGIAAFFVIGLVSPSSLLSWFAVAPLVATFFWAMWWGREIFREPGIAIGPLRELFDCVKWFLITFSLSALISRMDLLLVSRWGGLKEAGYYSAGMAFAMIPQLLGLYMSVVFGPSIMPRIRNGTFYPMFRSTQLLIFALVAGVYAAFLIFWGVLAPVVLPARYLHSAAVIKALVPGALAGMATFPLTLSFIMFTRPRFLFTMDCVSFPFLLVLYWYAIRHFGSAGAAWVTSFAALARATIAQAMAWRWARETRLGPAPIDTAILATAEI
jgi:O-antigen/teichoic acid export membrane protein